VNIQPNIVTFPTYPDKKFILDMLLHRNCRILGKLEAAWISHKLPIKQNMLVEA